MLYSHFMSHFTSWYIFWYYHYCSFAVIFPKLVTVLPKLGIDMDFFPKDIRDFFENVTRQTINMRKSDQDQVKYQEFSGNCCGSSDSNFPKYLFLEEKWILKFEMMIHSTLKMYLLQIIFKFAFCFFQSRVDFVQLMINAQRGENISKDEGGDKEEERSSGTGTVIYKSSIQRLNPHDIEKHFYLSMWTLH